MYIDFPGSLHKFEGHQVIDVDTSPHEVPCFFFAASFDQLLGLFLVLLTRSVKICF